MLEIRHLEILATLRDSETLYAAAQRLYLSASALSHALATLEARCGTELFIRRSRPVRFTRAGERLLALADEVLPSLRQAERDVARLAGSRGGRLHIAIECHSCYQWLMPTLDRYRTEWPEVELDLSGGFNFNPMPALRRGELDLVVTTDLHQQPELVFEPLFRHEVVVAVAENHRLRNRPFVSATDLAGETLVTYPVERSRLDVFRSFLEPAGIEPAAVRTADLTVMILQLVASGRGVAMLPRWALAEGGTTAPVVGVAVGPQGRHGTLYTATREASAAEPYIRGFIRTAREVSFDTLPAIAIC